MPEILDAFGRPYRPEKKPDERMMAVATIRDRWSTYPSNGLTPVKLAAILREADAGDVLRQSELFEEMEEKDPHLSAILQTRKLAVTGLDWNVLPYGDSPTPEDEKIADFCEAALTEIDGLDDALLDLLDAIAKGVAGCEILWGVADAKVVITGLSWIHQKRFSFWQDVVPRLVTDANFSGEEIPAWKIVFHRHKSRSGYDTRAGLMRVCAWMYLFKNYAVKDWVAFAEVFGVPLRIGKYDPGASSGDKDALSAAVQALGADAAGIISKNTEIEFVEAQRYGTVNLYRELASFCNQEMSKAVLGQTLTTQESSTGTQALGRVHADVRQDLLEADATALAQTLRRQILKPLVGFNFGWDKPVPWFRFETDPPEDLAGLSTLYKNLVEAGLEIGQQHAHERFGIPEPAEGEALLSPRGSAGPTAPVAAKRQPPASSLQTALVAKSVAETPQDAPGAADGPGEVLARLGDKALAVADFGPMLAPLEKILEQSTDLIDFQSRLVAARGDLDASEFGTLMQKALVLAHLAGRFDALPDVGSTAVPGRASATGEDARGTNPSAGGRP